MKRSSAIRLYVAALILAWYVPNAHADYKTSRIVILESACAGAAANTSVLCNDSTTHAPKISANNGSFLNVLLSAGSISVASGKTLTVNNSVTLIGTDGTSMTFPATTATLARTDAAQSFTGDQTFGAKVLGADNSTATTLGDTTHRFIGYVSREITGASTPTASIAAGFCTTPSVAVDTGSSDRAGILTITTGTGCAAATGSVTLTFSTGNGAYGTNTPSCVAMPFDGASAWDTGVTWKTTAQSTTAITFALKNGATNLTSSTTYKFNYSCTGK